MEILEKYLMNPNPPNEALIKAAQKYSDQVREKHTHINDFDVEPAVPEEKVQQREALIEMMDNDQKLGLLKFINEAKGLDKLGVDMYEKDETTNTWNKLALSRDQKSIKKTPCN